MEERILIVDDDQAICALIARRLRREGCSYITARRGGESLFYFHRDKSMVISNLDFRVLSGAIEAKDPYTRGHSDRVRSLSQRIGVKLGLKGKRLEDLVFGALLHDIGKIGIRDEVLQKPGKLSPEEYRHVQEHPLIGVKILEAFDSFKDKALMIRHHHEHFDGGGYPDRLVGEKIPVEARIIAISDAFDAMTSLRLHRPSMTLELALREMKECVEKQFDPAILEVFLKEKLYDSPQDYSAGDITED